MLRYYIIPMKAILYSSLLFSGFMVYAEPYINPDLVNRQISANQPRQDMRGSQSENFSSQGARLLIKTMKTRYYSSEPVTLHLVLRNEGRLPITIYMYRNYLYNFDIIVNISEDGWFGNSIGPHQHFIHSIFRAVESGKYLLRSANNGIAAIINPLGIIEQKIELGQSGYMDFSERKKIQPTVFSKYGNKIFMILILLYIFLIFSFNRFNNE